MKYLQISKWQIRPVIYASLITLGFGFLINFLEAFDSHYYFYGAIVLYLIVILEISITANFYHIYHRKNAKVVYDFETHKLIQFSHHLLLPTIIYWGFIAFIYYNSQPAFYLMQIILAFFTFVILFENLNSFYKHSFSLNKSTNYIYDFITILAVYLWTFIFGELIFNYPKEDIVLYFLYTLLIGLLCFLTSFRHTISKSISILNMVYVFFQSILFEFLLNSSSIALNIASYIICLCFTIYIYNISNPNDKALSKSDLIDIGVCITLILALLNLYY
jgi:hypothetical protein